MGDKEQPACKTDNLTAICEPIAQEIWELGRLTALLVSTACCKGM
jgi:hypothetical protein